MLNKSHRLALRSGESTDIIRQKWIAYRTAKLEAKLVVDRKRHSINKKIELDIKAAGKDQGKKFWRYLKRLRKHKSAADTVFKGIKSWGGGLLTDKQKVAGRILEYVRELEQALLEVGARTTGVPLVPYDSPMLASGSDGVQEVALLNVGADTTGVPLLLSECDGPLSDPVEAAPGAASDAHVSLLEPFSLAELSNVLAHLKAGKAAGADGMYGECLRSLGPLARNSFLDLLEDIRVRNAFPVEWGEARVVLIHKGHGKDVTDLDAYRPIAVTSTVYKVYAMLLKNRLSEFLETTHSLHEAQAGFRTDRRLADHLFILTTLIELSTRSGKPLEMVFLDVSKAYDSVNRERLWHMLTDLDIPTDFVSTLRNIYSTCDYSYSLNDITTSSFASAVGLRQGCPLSPLLFLVYIDPLPVALSRLNLGVSLTEADGTALRFSCLLYADDIALLADSRSDMARMLQICEGVARAQGLSFNVTKSKAMSFSPVADAPPVAYQLQGHSLESVTSFVYLGVTLSSVDHYLAAMENSIRLKCNRYRWAVRNLSEGSYNKYLVGRTLWKMVAVPAVTFANEVLCFKTQINALLDSTQRAVGKNALNAGPFAANVAIQGEMGWSTMEAREAKSKLKYLGRLKFMQDSRLAKRLYAHVRAGGINTEWTRRVAILDRKHAIGVPRGHCTRYAEWVACVEKAVTTNAERLWRRGVEAKPSLVDYSSKEKPCTESFYDGGFVGGLLFQARSGSLLTGARQTAFGPFSANCKLCDCPFEDLRHVLLVCPATDDGDSIRAWRADNREKPTAEFLGLTSQCWSPHVVGSILAKWKSKKNLWRTANAFPPRLPQ